MKKIYLGPSVGKHYQKFDIAANVNETLIQDTEN